MPPKHRPKATPLTEAAIKTKKARFKISDDDYGKWEVGLTELGFSLEQIQAVILRQSPKNSVTYLIGNASKFLNHLGFNHDQLTAIAKKDGGSLNLAAITKYFEDLKSAPSPFTNEQLVSIVGTGGGSRNLAAVMADFEALKADPYRFTS